MSKSEKPKARLIIGIVVTKPLGTEDRYRNPMTALAFILQVFGREPELGEVWTTLTLENETPGSSVNKEGGFDIMSGTIEMMRSTLAGLGGAVTELSEGEGADGSASLPTTMIQLCVGSTPFAQLFMEVMAKMLQVNVDQWLGRLRGAVGRAKPGDVIWLDMMDPGKIHHPNLQDMMRKAIPHMVL